MPVCRFSEQVEPRTELELQPFGLIALTPLFVTAIGHYTPSF
jgi:hypothetical protein